ncbi:MAG: DEAD/DEAH box helicase [Promethearchaeota archaeon]
MSDDSFPNALQVTFLPPNAKSPGSFFFWFVPGRDTHDYDIELAQRIMSTFGNAWAVAFENASARLYLPRAILDHGKELKKATGRSQLGSFLRKYKASPSSSTMMVLARGKRASVVDGVRLFAELSTRAELAGGGPGVELAPSDSVQGWADAAKFALELVARCRVFPVLEPGPGGTGRAGAAPGEFARWALFPESDEDQRRLDLLVENMPPAGYLVPVRAPDGEGGKLVAAAARSVLDAFLRATADQLVRALVTPEDMVKRPGDGEVPTTRSVLARKPRRGVPTHPEHDKYRRVVPPWDERLAVALLETNGGAFPHVHFADRAVRGTVRRWTAPFTMGPRSRGYNVCCRLSTPRGDSDSWPLEFVLRGVRDPRPVVEASVVWQAEKDHLEVGGVEFEHPQRSLVLALGVLSNLFPPVRRCLRETVPAGVDLSFEEACSFLKEVLPVLPRHGMGAILPDALAPGGDGRLSVRITLEDPPDDSLAFGFDVFSLTEYDWQVAVGDSPVTSEEFESLLAANRPLAKMGDKWVFVNPSEVELLREVSAGKSPASLSPLDVVQGALEGSVRLEGIQDPIKVVLDAKISSMMETLRGASRGLAGRGGDGVDSGLPVVTFEVPESFNGALRPYQERGARWLRGLCSWGFGACLADDMGLGKTVQVIAFVLERLESGSAHSRTDRAPALVVCPTSVLWNWEAELGKFAPTLRVAFHYGPSRPKTRAAFSKFSKQHDVILTTYGTATRDSELLGGVEFDGVIVDEAQNIKNPETQQARAIKSLKARYRVALTGTPVENRLSELWSILDFLNPGFLGSLSSFRKKFAVPIERFRDPEALALLKRLVDPFILRRSKTDKSIITDLPEKSEVTVYTPLTVEQAALYKNLVADTMEKIDAAEGIQRRGLVLSLLTKLKQVCNHPVQVAGEFDAGSLPGVGELVERSGKVQRLLEMCEEILANSEKALVFTQYTRTAEILVKVLEGWFGKEVLYLHGGVAGERRGALVDKFQDDPDNARPFFVVSLRAGGTGLNLTRATYVVHFDRWWNPAVEDQATDRAFRIGQEKNVQVFKFTTRGTVEEKIDAMISQKKELAATVVTTGEQFVTELSTEDLRDLFTLQESAVGVTGEANGPVVGGGT